MAVSLDTLVTGFRGSVETSIADWRVRERCA
jgi:hypothetical protein